MLLGSYDVLVVGVPLDRPFMGLSDMRHVILRLRSDDGVEGLGWAGSFDPALAPALASAVNAMAGGLIGADPTHIRELMAKVGRRLAYWGPGLTRYVEAVIDVAMHDLCARAAGVSVASFLGGGGVEAVPTYASQHLWRDWDLDALHQGAGALVDAGWRSMKFRIGANRLAADEAERARVVREAVGDDIAIMVDVNQGWTVARTKEVAPLLEPYRLAWLEDPIDYRDIAGYQRLGRIEGGAYINAGDYATFLLMNLRGGMCGDEQVLSQAALDTMHTDRLAPTYNGDAGDPDAGYGMGWWVSRETERISDPGAWGAVPWLDLDDGYGAYLIIEEQSATGQELARQLEDLVHAAVTDS